MNVESLQQYILPILIILYFGWRFYSNKKAKSMLPDLLNRGATIVDVRSPGEFKAGHHPHSLNIPLGELDSKISKLDKNKPVILCCASGSRSAMAVGILKKNGFIEVINAGPWTNTIL